MLEDPKQIDYLREATGVLAAAGVFNGASWDMGPSPSPFEDLFVSINSDQVSATNGAKIQFSDDNATWDTAVQATTAVSTPLVLTSKVLARYMRVQLTQGATPGVAAPIIRSMRRKAAKGFGTP